MPTKLTISLICTDGDLAPATLTAAARAFGIPFQQQDGSHASATLLLQDGVDLDTIADHLGQIPGSTITRDTIVQ